MNLSNYHPVTDKTLQELLDIYERIENLIHEGTHEDVIDYMLAPIATVLKHHGVNLDEQDF